MWHIDISLRMTGWMVVNISWNLSQDSGGMLSLLGMIEQCLKAGKKQPWHAASVTNICVGLLSGFKVIVFPF